METTINSLKEQNWMEKSKKRERERERKEGKRGDMKRGGKRRGGGRKVTHRYEDIQRWWWLL